LLSLFFKFPNTRKYQWKLTHCYIRPELKVIFFAIIVRNTVHLIYLDILCTESDIYWRKQNWIFTFQTTSLPNFQTNCTVLKIIPNFESKERFYLGQYSVKSGLFWVSFFKDALWEKSGYEGHTKYLISNVIGGVWKTQF